MRFSGKYASDDGKCLIKGGTLIAFAPADIMSYTIPDLVTTIGDSAFENCICLRDIVISKNVNLIGEKAFYECNNLISIIFESLEPPYFHVFDYYQGSFCWDALSYHSSERKIFVPEESLDKYHTSSYLDKYSECILGYNNKK